MVPTKGGFGGIIDILGVTLGYLTVSPIARKCGVRETLSRIPPIYWDWLHVSSRVFGVVTIL